VGKYGFQFLQFFVDKAAVMVNLLWLELVEHIGPEKPVVQRFFTESHGALLSLSFLSLSFLVLLTY
jgi:hypothetical protein